MKKCQQNVSIGGEKEERTAQVSPQRPVLLRVATVEIQTHVPAMMLCIISAQKVRTTSVASASHSKSPSVKQKVVNALTSAAVRERFSMAFAQASQTASSAANLTATQRVQLWLLPHHCTVLVVTILTVIMGTVLLLVVVAVGEIMEKRIVIVGRLVVEAKRKKQ